MAQTTTKQPTPRQLAEMERMKACFPFRIAYGALHPNTNEFIASAVTTKRVPNKLSREGWFVWVLA